MITNPYSVTGIYTPTLKGRESAFDTLLRHLTKPTPDHVSVIGPKFIGKTVFLNGVGEYFRQEGSQYAAVLYWDLRHGTPRTDQEFYCKFALQLRDPIRKVDPELVEVINENELNLLASLSDIFELLQEDSKLVLVILDGLDEMLRTEGITRNLWDYLRSLAELSSLRFVTGSRRRLRELCASPESRTSDFWNIFYETPLSIGPFDDNDWSEFLKPFSEKNIDLDSSAQKELRNWTGGVPVFAASIASRLFERYSTGETISKAQVDEVAEEVLSACQDHLDDLWSDCPAEEQGDLVDLAQNGELLLSVIPYARRTSLELRGYAVASGNKLKSTCRLMIKHASRRGEHITDLRRVFGDLERYERNIPSLLELRLAQVKNVDLGNGQRAGEILIANGTLQAELFLPIEGANVIFYAF